MEQAAEKINGRRVLAVRLVAGLIISVSSRSRDRMGSTDVPNGNTTGIGNGRCAHRE
jgi:hypothetical protein